MTSTPVLERMKASPIFMGRVCMPAMFGFRTPAFHYELESIYLDPLARKVNIVAPRGHAKSSLIAGSFVLHHLMFGEGRKVIILVSKTLPHAVRLLGTVKDVLNYSAGFRKHFGYWGEHSAIKWTDAEIHLKDGSAIICRGTAQQVLGLKVGHQRPTFVVVDDPEDANNTKTDEAMETNFRWLSTQLVPTRDAQRGKVWVIGTPQHQRCIVETLMGAKGWVSKRYQALTSDVATNDELQKDILEGKVVSDPSWALWHEMWPAHRLLEEKESLASVHRVSIWWREYMCQVISDETSLFKREDVRYWEGDFEKDKRGFPYIRFADGNFIPVNVFIGIDPATSISATADETAIIPVAVTRKKDIYVLDVIHGRWRPSEVIDRILAAVRKYSPRLVNLEASAQQETYRDFLRQQQQVIIPGLHRKLIPRDRKEKRYLDILEPLIASHKIHIRRGQLALLNQLLAYGQGARHDDMLDALYWACTDIWPPDHSERPITGDEPLPPREVEGYMVA